MMLARTHSVAHAAYSRYPVIVKLSGADAYTNAVWATWPKKSVVAPEEGRDPPLVLKHLEHVVQTGDCYIVHH
jgi:hypothetical protein